MLDVYFILSACQLASLSAPWPNYYLPSYFCIIIMRGGSRVRQNTPTMRWCIVNDNGIMDAAGWREVQFMELPESYIPIDRRLAIARGVDLPARSSGAALFADISGFTPLTETLTRELGPQRGAEELSRQLIVIYSALIAQVEQYCGSVISFSGDAITCWFDDAGAGGWGRGGGEDRPTANPPPPAPAALRALACALAMQEALSYFATVETPSGDSVA